MMIELLVWSSVVLAVVGSSFVGALVARRIFLARLERAQVALEQRLRPVALALAAGEAPERSSLNAADGEAVARLLKRYARSLDGNARSHIAGFFESGSRLEPALEALRARAPWRRATAAFALGDMGSSRATPALLTALDDASREVRSAAARSLGRLGAVEAVEPLVLSLAEGRIPHAVAGHALLTIGPTALPPLRLLEERADAEVRTAAVELVGLLGEASDGGLLRKRLRDSSAEVRVRAAIALGRLGAAEAAAGLRDALQDRIPSVRAAAATALGLVGDRAAVPALLHAARQERFDAAQAAAVALARIDPKSLAAAAADAPHLLEARDLVAAAAL